MNALRRPVTLASRSLIQRRYASAEARRVEPAGTEARQEGKNLASAARRDPELFPLWLIVGSTLCVAAWYLTRNPTSSSSENVVGRADKSEPWHTGKDAKYEFHPHGDTRNPRKEAPSALNEVIVPNVTLPKHLHEKYNKYGKEGF